MVREVKLPWSKMKKVAWSKKRFVVVRKKHGKISFRSMAHLDKNGTCSGPIVRTMENVLRIINANDVLPRFDEKSWC